MWKLALQSYIKKPERFDQWEVPFYDETVVIVEDKFAKSEVHLLVLPRDIQLTTKNPSIALTENLKSKLQCYIDRAHSIAFKRFSKRFINVKDHQPLDKTSFIENFIQVGVHSVPSMENLHIHVITRDFHSERLKHKRHYNSFNTEFFINWDQLPLSAAPDKIYMEKEILAKSDMICSYCNANFTNKFAKLRTHLQEEFSKHYCERNDVT